MPGARLPLADRPGGAYMQSNSGALASTPKAPPEHTTGPLARFFMSERLNQCLT